MRVMVTDFGARHRALAKRLAGTGLEVGVAFPGEPVARAPTQDTPAGAVAADAAGPSFVPEESRRGVTPRPGLTVAEFSPGDDPGHLRKLAEGRPGRPLVVVCRAAAPEFAQVGDLGITVMFPGFDASEVSGATVRNPRLLGLPGTVVGPLAGRPRSVDRWLAGVLRQAGIRASCRPDMQAWLTVTSAWLSPLRGAIIAAAQHGLALGAMPDLITLATGAARERLSLLRSCGFNLGARCACLVALPEWWAIKAMRSIAGVLPRDGGLGCLATREADAREPGCGRVAPRDGDLWCLPTAEEAMAVSRSLATMARKSGIRTPAADLLDIFSSGEASHGDRHDVSATVDASSASNPEEPDRQAAPGAEGGHLG